MKKVRETVEAMVLFQSDRVSPIFITYNQGNLRIEKVIKSWKECRNFRDCYIYLCQAQNRKEPVELRWDIESNKWFIEKV